MHLGTAAQAVAQNPSKSTTSSSTTSKKTSSGERKWERKLPATGWDFSMLISRSMKRAQRAWGSICIPTGIGAVWINDVTVKMNEESGDIRTSLPFKTKPNRAEGGVGEMIPWKGEHVYVVTGPKSYDNAVSGPGSMKAARLFLQAYDICSQCAEMRDIDPSKVEELVNKRISLTQKLANTTKKAEVAEIDSQIFDIDKQIERLNKRCHSNKRSWNVEGETADGEGAEVTCSCDGFIPTENETSEDSVENLTLMVNSVLDELTAPEVIEESEADENESDDECPY